jgi:VCBS repeat-containing protein
MSATSPASPDIGRTVVAEQALATAQTQGASSLPIADGRVLTNGTSGDDVIIAGETRDIIFAGAGDDHVSAGAGNDLVDGGGGNDTIDGGSGDDTLNGGSGDDLLFGGDGADRILGGTGDDAGYGGSGNDYLDGGQGNDRLDGGDGNDVLVGGTGDDTLFGGTGADIAVGGSGGDHLDGGEGDDTLSGGDGNDLVVGGSGNDALSGDAGADSLFGGDGSDRISGGAGADLLDGGAGADALQGGAGDDTVMAGDGNDWVIGEAGSDFIAAGDGNDWVSGGAGEDFVSGDAGDDYLEGGDGRDTLLGGDGNDRIVGGNGADDLFGDRGADQLWGGAGEDRLRGGDGNDGLYAGEGDDSLQGDEGNDLLLGEAGADTLHGDAGNDTLRGGTGNDRLYGGLGADMLTADEGNDFVSGGDGADTLDGGVGNDTISGGQGADLAIFDAARRNDDTVSEYAGNEGVDTLRLLLTAEQFRDQAVRSELAAYVSTLNTVSPLDSDGTPFVFDSLGLVASTFERIEIIVDSVGVSLTGGGGGGRGPLFSNGTDYVDFNSVSKGTYIDGTQYDARKGNDTVVLADTREAAERAGYDVTRSFSGGDGADQIFGGGLDDSIQGDSGNDALFGGGGADFLSGGAGNDTLNGEDGDDRLEGGDGNDSFIASFDAVMPSPSVHAFVFDGLAISVDLSERFLMRDTIVGGAGIDVLFAGSRSEAIVAMGLAGAGSSDVERYDLGAGNDVLILDSGPAASVTAGVGDDQVWGSAGADTLLGGEGSDTLAGGAGNDRIVGEAGNDAINGGSGADDLIGGAGNDMIFGGSGADTLSGDAGTDSLDGAEGDDVVNGGDGADSLDGGAGADRLFGGRDDDRIAGGDGNDFIDGSHGNDVASGGVGDDTLHGGDGADAMRGGDGADIVAGDAGNDTLDGEDGDDLLSGGDGADRIDGGRGADALFGGAGNDMLDGGEDDDVLIGEEGDDLIAGGDGADVLAGGKGRDTILGGAGSDTVVFAADTIASAGTTGVFGSAADYGFLETVALERYGISNDRVDGGDGADTYLGSAGHDAILLADASTGQGSLISSIETFELGDGDDILNLTSQSAVYTHSVEVHGGTGRDIIWAGSGSDTLLGGSGADWLKGGAGNDFMSGDDGMGLQGGWEVVLHDASVTDSFIAEDVLDGGSGNDTLVGGSGNDLLDGGSGIDTAIYSGLISDYKFSRSALGALVVTGTGSGSADGIDKLVSVELLQFADGARVSTEGLGYNSVPDAQDGTAVGAEDDVIIGQLVASDANGDSLTYALAEGGAPANGSVTVNPDGSYSYVPNANFNGSDSFTYTVSDGNGGTAAGTITVDVAAVNDGPTTVGGTAAAAEDAVVTGQIAAGDVDGDTLSFALAEGGAPTNGSVTLNSDGSYSYVPNANFNGSDSFTYTVSDGQGGITTGTIAVAVAAINDAPVAGEETVVGDEDTVIAGQLAATDVDGDALAYALEVGPANGTVVLEFDGSYTYVPNPDFHGTDAFTYTVSDGKGGMATGTITVDVTAVNDGPTAGADSAATGEDSAVTILASTILSNDSDPDAGDTLKIAGVSTSTAGVSVSLDANGNVVYNPGQAFQYLRMGQSATDTFSYTVRDSSGAEATTSVMVTVTGANEVIFGTSGNDDSAALPAASASSINGTPWSDQVDALAGDDRILPGADNDTIDGGAGSDVVDYAGTPGSVIADLATGVIQDGFGGIDYVMNVEDVAGGMSNDVLTGNSGDNTFTPRGGNDTVTGGGGSDQVNYRDAPGGVMVDLAAGTAIDGYGGTDTLVGISNALGSHNDDVLLGNSSNNSLRGRGGNDYLNGGGGTDRADYREAASGITVDLSQGVASNDGDGGQDTLVSIERVRGSEFNDRISGDAGANRVEAQAGDDLVYGLGGNDDLRGAAGNDTIYGGAGGDLLYGGEGNDLLDGGDGDDVFRGGAGNDTFIGSGGNDYLSFFDSFFADSSAPSGVTVNLAEGWAKDGAGGIDTLNGTFGGVEGSSFGDFLFGNGASQWLDGGSGNDTIDGAAGDDNLRGASGNDLVYGGAGNDFMEGGGGNDSLYGGSGNDFMIGGSNDDALDGGTGSDSARFSGSRSQYSIRGLADGRLQVDDLIAGRDGSDILTNIDILSFSDQSVSTETFFNVINGTPASDTLTGSIYRDIISGQDGRDLINGGAGNDELRGGGGIDTLTGGTGRDTFVFDKLEPSFVSSTQVTTVVLNGSTYRGDVWQLSIAGPITATVAYTVTAADESGSNSGNAAMNWAAKINADPILSGFLTAVGDYAGHKITLTAKQADVSFTPTVTVADASPSDNSANYPLSASVANTTTMATVVPVDTITDFVVGASAQVTTVVLNGSTYRGDVWTLDVSGPVNATISYTVSADDEVGANSGNAAMNWAAKINADPVLSSLLTAVGDYAGHKITLTAKQAGISFDPTVTVTDASPHDNSAVYPISASVMTVNGEMGDIIDISEILVGFEPGSSALGDFLQVFQNGTDTVVRVDANGATGGTAFVDLALLQGVTGVGLDDLLLNNQVRVS